MLNWDLIKFEPLEDNVGDIRERIRVRQKIAIGELLADLPRNDLVRYSEDQPRDEYGKWTSGGGGTVEGAGTGAGGFGKVYEPDTGKKGKPKVDDFEKSKVALGHFKSDKARFDKFADSWTDRVGETPTEFKSAFLGGVDATMKIDAVTNNDWRIEGSFLDARGTAGTYARNIDFRSKTAESAYFELTRSTGRDTGKRVLAGNVAAYQKMGIEKVTVHADINVGGYAWAKYGYVPTARSWATLRSEISRKLGSGGSRGRDSDRGQEPESWDEIGDDDQERIKDAWISSARSDYINSEEQNWRDSGQALDQAKSDLAEKFSGSHSADDWARDAIQEVIDDHRDNGDPIPYTTGQILDALTVSYQNGYDGEKDPEWEFHDQMLLDPSNAPPKDQLMLPGFKKGDLSKHLTEDHREKITDALTKAFNDTAQKQSEEMDAPDYLSDDADEQLSEHWDSMRDRDRYRWARDNDRLPIYQTGGEDEEPEEVDATPDEVTELQKLANSSDPKAIWAIADSPKGKELLLNSDWNGVLDLKDKESMERFNAYVGKTKAA